jgi:glutamate transport system permease protein
MNIFEAAGPRGRRRQGLVTWIAAVAILSVAALTLEQLNYAGQLLPERWNILFDPGYVSFLLGGLWTTIQVGVVSTVLSAVFGMILAAARMSSRRYLSVPAVGFIEFFRAMPLLLILFFVMFALPPLGFTLPAFWQLVVAITLNAGVIFAEIFRAGILAIGRGQREAGLAVGLSPTQTMRFIIFPQAVRSLMPALVSQSVRVIKESSLGYVVGVTELLNNGRVLAEFTGNFIQAYAGVAAAYIVLNYCLSSLAEWLSNRQKGLRAGKQGTPNGRKAGTIIEKLPAAV